MEEPPPSATWHPALRPETLDDGSLYSPDFNGPRQVTLSWDDMIARTPMRSRAPTHSLQQVQQAMPTSIEEELEDSTANTMSTNSFESQAVSSAISKTLSAEDDQEEEVKPSIPQDTVAARTELLTIEETHANTDLQACPPALPQPSTTTAQLRDEAPAEDLDNLASSTIKNTAVQEVEYSTAHDETPSKNHVDQVAAVHNSSQDAPFTPLPDLDQNEIDSAWGNITSNSHTNSFPPVPPVSIEIPASPLPSSQAAAILQERHPESEREIFETQESNEYHWEASSNKFGDGDDGFFSQSGAQDESQQIPFDDEARYEEGIPLVAHNTAAEKPDSGDTAGPNLDFANEATPYEEDFFAGLGEQEDPFNSQPAALTRKTTEQVLNTMQFSQNAHPTENDLGSRQIDNKHSAASMISQDISEDLVANAVVTPGAKDELAALLEAELDDDLLDETMDPTTFFGDVDDGFLNDGDLLPSTDSTAAYAVDPANYQLGQSRSVDTFSNSAAPSYIPADFDAAAYKRNQSPFQTQPTQPAIIERAQSFADKSKGGYASPYDLPMDVSRPKRVPARGPQVLTRGGPAAPPPPRRTDSVQSGYIGTPTLPPQLSPALSGHLPTGYGQQATTSPPQIRPPPQRPSSSGFFEELPMTQKPRPTTSTSRFMPQSALPQSAPPQQAVQQPPNRYPPQQTQPQHNQFGLVGPAKVMPYADPTDAISSPTVLPQAVQTPSSVAGRYSPSVSQQTTKQSMPQQSRTVPPNPYATPTSIPRPPSVPHQYTPSQPVPLVRSSSANQYRPGDRPAEGPAMDLRQIAGMRRPSLLSHAQNTDELPSPVPPQQLSKVDSPFASSFATTDRNSPEDARDTKPPNDMGRRASHLPAHQEIDSPRSPYIQQKVAPQRHFHATPVESYSLSQQAILTNANRVRAPSMTGNDNFIVPQDATAQDPLQRWQGAPIFRFGFGGTIVSTFPARIPRYTQGSRMPSIKCNPGEVRILSAKVLPSNERIATFPGPLKNKNKKKDVLLWLHNSIASLAQNHTELLGQGVAGDEQKRHEEKIMLWKIVATIVEHDGTIDGNVSALDAIRKILSPEASTHEDQQSVTQPFLPAISSPDLAFKPSAAGSSAVDTIRQHLLSGEREKAVWYAVDQKLWGHAMLLASTMPRDLWKQVCHEFVRNEVKFAGRNTESLAALYDIFAGNWEESVDELVPPSARAGLTLMNKNLNGAPASSGLDGLNRWRETLNLILSNRAVEDVKAIVAMGQLLASYGRVEAAHICYIFSKVPGLFGGPDDPQSAVVLLGADHKQAAWDCLNDTDSILLTEVLEFVQIVLNPTPSQVFALPHLQAFKLYHADLLADLGLRDEAQQYCDAITSALKANTNRSTYFHSQLSTAVDALGVRLRQSGKEGMSSWISRPNVDKVSGSFLKALSGFIAGDEDDASVNSAKADAEGPFARINGNTPEMISRTSSPAVGGYGQYSVSQGYGAVNPLLSAAVNSRYAPIPAALPEHALPASSGYETPAGIASSGYAPFQPQSAMQMPMQIQSTPPVPNVSKYSPGNAAQYQPPAGVPIAHSGSRLSPQSSDAGSSRPGTSYEPRDSNSLLSPGPRSSSHRSPSVSNSNRYSPAPDHMPRSTTLEPHYSSSASQPRSYAHSPNRESGVPQQVESYQPAVPMYGEYSNENTSNTYPVNENTATSATTGQQESIGTEDVTDEQPSIDATSAAGLDAPSYGGYQPPSAGYEPPSAGYGPPSAGYEPPTAGYEPPSYGYEPPSYDPEATEGQEVASPKKKKSFMNLDDDEDDLASRAAALKKSQKAAKDKEADDAFRRAAEEDAKKAAVAKAGGGWLSGIWGRGSKEASQVKPKASRIHEGEKNSFVFDKELNKWVNTKAGAEAATANAPTPPPPRGPPKPVASTGPPNVQAPTSNPMNGPPGFSKSGSVSPALNATIPPGGQSGLMPGLVPPSRPSTGMSVASNASSIDDLMGPAQPRKGGTMKRGKKRAGYVDVLADKT